jgi:hypothetical protein
MPGVAAGIRNTNGNRARMYRGLLDAISRIDDVRRTRVIVQGLAILPMR